MRRALIRWAGASLVAFALILLAPPLASAHGELVLTEPSDGAVLSDPPAEIGLWFSEPVVEGFAHVRVVDGSGEPVPGVSWAVDATDPARLRVFPGSIHSGVFFVRWSVAFDRDAHPAEGEFAFSVGEAGAAAVPDPGGQDPAVAWGEAALRWLTLLSLAGLIGAVTVHGLVLPGPGSSARARAATVALWSGLISVALMAGGLVLATERLSDAGRTSLPRALVSAISATGWGGRAVAGIVLVSLLSWASARASHGSERALLYWSPPLVSGIVLVQALSGHATEVPSASAVTVLADAVHLLAACVWVGGMAALMVCFPPGKRPAGRARDAWKRFGPVAGVSVALLAATGLYALADRTGTDPGSTQGRGLGIMVGAFLVAALLGGLNFLSLRRTPHVDVPRFAPLEIGFGLVAFLAAAAVASVPLGLLPGGVEATPSIRAMDAEDLIVTVEATPNLPGRNAVTVLVASIVRPPAGRVSSVSAATATAKHELRRIGEGRFRGVLDLPAGQANLSVRVERAGAKDVVLEVPWSVAPARVEPRRPDPSLAGYLLIGAAAIMAILGLGVALALSHPARRPGEGGEPERLSVRRPV